jgi:phosphatidylinositol 4-kinase
MNKKIKDHRVAPKRKMLEPVMVHLVDCLSHTAPLDQILRLLSQSPSLGAAEGYGEHGVDHRSLQATLAIAHYATRSNQHTDIVHTQIFHTLVGISQAMRKNPASPNNEVVQGFAKEYTEKILILAEMHTERSGEFIHSIVKLLELAAEKIHSQGNVEEHSKILWPYILVGALEALANHEGFIDTKESAQMKLLLGKILEVDRIDVQNEEKRVILHGIRKATHLTHGAISALLNISSKVFQEFEIKALYKSGFKHIYSLISLADRRKNVTDLSDLSNRMRYHIALLISCCKNLHQDYRYELSKKLVDIIRRASKGKDIDFSGSGVNLADLGLTSEDKEPEKEKTASLKDEFAKYFAKEALSGLVELCKVFVDLIPEVLDKLFSILMEPELSLISLSSEISSTISDIVKKELENKELPFANSSTRRLILQLEGNLQSSAIDASFEKFEHLNLMLLSNITLMAKNSKVSSQVLPVLFQKFQINPRLLHPLVKNLADIALGSDDDTFERILNLFIDIYRKPFSQENRYTYTEIRNSLSLMANSALGKKQKILFTQSILRLIPSLGASIQAELLRIGNKQFSSLVGTLGFILPTLSDLVSLEQNQLEYACLYIMKDSPPIGFQAFQNEISNIRNFRSIWLLLVLFKFVDTSSNYFLPEWVSAVRNIAVNSPVLVLNKDRNYLDLEFEAQTVIRTSSDEESIKQSFRKVLPELESLSAQLSCPKLLFVLTIYHLETMRAQSGSFHTVFIYLENDTLGSGLFASFIGAIADHAFSQFISFLESEKKRDAKLTSHNLINHVIFLLVKLFSRKELAREKALKYIEDLMTKFSYLRWNRLCISSALDLLQKADAKRRTLDAITECIPQYEEIPLKIPFSDGVYVRNIVIDFPETLAIRETIFKSCGRLVSKWIEFSAGKVPIELLSVLQEYTQDHSFSIDNKSFFSESLGVTSSSSLKYIAAEIKSSMSISTAPAFAISLSRRQKYIGIIQGLYESYICNPASSNIPFGVHMMQVLQRQFKEIQKASKENDLLRSRDVLYKCESLNNLASNFILTAAALLIWSLERSEKISADEHKKIEQKDLMHYLCMCPAVVFTSEAMQSAIFAWHWLFSANGAFAVSLFLNMKVAWAYTIENRKGIFRKNVGDTLLSGEYPGCLFSAKHSSESDDVRVSLEPHRLWIDFMAESIEVTKKTFPSCFRSMVIMMNSSLASPEFLMTLPASFFVRFKLLHVALTLIHSDGFEAFELLDLLRDRVYLASFFWFFESPRWMTAQSSKEYRDLAKLIISFCKLLQFDTRQVPNLPEAAVPSENKSSSSGKSRASKISRNVSKSVFDASYKSFTTSSSDPNWVKAWSNTPALKDLQKGLIIERNLSSGSSKISSAVSVTSYGAAIGGEGVLKKLSSHKDLLIFLMSHELHRIIAWYNPSRAKDKFFEDQELFADIVTNAQDSHWEKLFDIAWSINSKLAFRLVQRFPQAKPLVKKLTDKLKDSPNALFEIGDAVSYLATEENVLNDALQLKYLEYFQPCSLPVALKFLTFPYSSNQMVMEYTMRSLSAHGPDAVIFYLNEIVQAMRYDTFGILRRFLLYQSKKSPYLAHQLIWACQTESVPENEGVRGSGLLVSNDPVPFLCQSLEKEIINSMSPQDKLFYQSQFFFFTEITKLSKELVVIPKSDKPRRNAELRNRLAKVKLDRSGLYLPIDHHSEILEIKAETGITLQSASRVPFLVSFRIKNRDSKEEIDDKIQEESKNQEIDPKTSSEQVYDQAVIFKAGDDVRQDCLALQFIRLMKDIMNSVGLKLFLMPYKVIPNRTGAEKDLGGVIQCIPKAKSRDELGKSNNRSLKQEFMSRYGKVESQAYKSAQRNFIMSLAGYAVASYILQVKDRHNGNIMIDEWGHLIHIDFGFIFSISPGNDMRFERANFKFTTEMAELMDGVNSDLYKWFEEMCVRGYLAVRDHAEDFYNIANLMMDSPLGCFKPTSMQELRSRFALDKSERDAALTMLGLIQNAYNNVTTNVYDQIQWQREGVWYFSGGGEE